MYGNFVHATNDASHYTKPPVCSYFTHLHHRPHTRIDQRPPVSTVCSYFTHLHHRPHTLPPFVEKKVKMKPTKPRVQRIGGVLTSLSYQAIDLGGAYITWSVRRHTYSYLPSRRASPPFERFRFTLPGDRGAYVCGQLA